MPESLERRRRRYATDPDYRERKKDNARRYQRTPEENRYYSIRHMYGLGREEYDAILEDQDGKCAICMEEFTITPRVDHDHLTGKVRALLCAKCNTLLGFLEHPLREAAESYLQRFGQ